MYNNNQYLVTQISRYRIRANTPVLQYGKTKNASIFIHKLVPFYCNEQPECFRGCRSQVLGTDMIDCVWNVLAHAQKPDFVFWRNGRVYLNRWRASVQSTTGSRGVRISGSNAGYTMFRGSVKGTGYPLHSPVSPSLPFPRVTVCHHISTGVYHLDAFQFLTITFLRMKLHKPSQKF